VAVTSAPTTLTEQGDASLLRAAYTGNAAAFEELFLRHRGRVYSVARRIVGNHEEAEEITLDVFLRLHQQRLTRLDDANVAGWLYRSATNAAFNVVRARQRRRRWLWRFATLRDEAQVADDPANELERASEAAAVRAALAGLPEKQRNVLALRAEGLSYKEIADTLDLKVSSIGSTLARAERALGAAYDAGNGR
jgi:RNA polymerase sigma-70 factor (ECF subfamily)